MISLYFQKNQRTLEASKSSVVVGKSSERKNYSIIFYINLILWIWIISCNNGTIAKLAITWSSTCTSGSLFKYSYAIYQTIIFIKIELHFSKWKLQFSSIKFITSMLKCRYNVYDHSQLMLSTIKRAKIAYQIEEPHAHTDATLKCLLLVLRFPRSLFQHLHALPEKRNTN